MTRYGDGSIYRRGSTLWIRYSHRGREFRESTHTTNERLANKLLKQRLAQTVFNKIFRDEERILFADLARAVVADYRVEGYRSLPTLQSNLKTLENYFGADCRAVDISTSRVREYIISRQEAGIKPASINRELAILSKMLSLDGIITTKPKIRSLPVSNARPGFIEYPDFQRLLAMLPHHLQDPIHFLYLSAWRSGEVKTLEWKDIDLKNRELRLRPEHSKNSEPRLLPLRGELLAIIQRAAERRRLDCRLVFHRDGRSLGRFDKNAWRTACKKAGLAGLLVHDLRRSGIRNMTRAGVSENVAMTISGHRTRSVFARYDITSQSDKAKALDLVQEHLAATTTPGKVAVLKP